MRLFWIPEAYLALAVMFTSTYMAGEHIPLSLAIYTTICVVLTIQFGKSVIHQALRQDTPVVEAVIRIVCSAGLGYIFFVAGVAIMKLLGIIAQ